MKYILLIGDGMADNPVASLDNKTPLEYASIPTIDRLAQQGLVGTVKTIPDGQPAGSDTAMLGIFGCDPLLYNKGRAPLEAAASGIHVPAGAAAYRCNMVALEDADVPFAEKRILSHSGGDVEGDESIALIGHVFADPAFAAKAAAAGVIVHPSPSFRHIAVQENADLSGFRAFPPHDYLDEVIAPILPVGNENAATLRELMELAHEILDRHPINEARREKGLLPANGIWLWAEGLATDLPQFADQFGKTGGVISAVPLCHGIAALAGLNPIRVEGATGKLHTNYEGKVEAAIACLKAHPFVAVHVEAPDECTHNGDLPGKLQAIEWFDSRVVEKLLARLQEEGLDAYRILLLSDHKTLLSTRGHDPDPVPFLIYDSRTERTDGLCYHERDAEKGVYHERGTVLMDLLFGE